MKFYTPLLLLVCLAACDDSSNSFDKIEFPTLANYSVSDESQQQYQDDIEYFNYCNPYRKPLMDSIEQCLCRMNKSCKVDNATIIKSISFMEVYYECHDTIGKKMDKKRADVFCLCTAAATSDEVSATFSDIAKKGSSKWILKRNAKYDKIRIEAIERNQKIEFERSLNLGDCHKIMTEKFGKK